MRGTARCTGRLRWNDHTLQQTGSTKYTTRPAIHATETRTSKQTCSLADGGIRYSNKLAHLVVDERVQLQCLQGWGRRLSIWCRRFYSIWCRRFHSAAAGTGLSRQDAARAVASTCCPISPQNADPLHAIIAEALQMAPGGPTRELGPVGKGARTSAGFCGGCRPNLQAKATLLHKPLRWSTCCLSQGLCPDPRRWAQAWTHGKTAFLGDG